LRLIEEKLGKALSNLAIAQPTTQATESQPVTKAPIKEPEVIDWSGMSNTDLWSTKIKGASEEKIRRCFNAIALYNDTVATGDDDRLARYRVLRLGDARRGRVSSGWVRHGSGEVGVDAIAFLGEM